MNILNKTFFKSTILSLVLLSTSFLVAKESEVDKKINSILQASPEQKKDLIKELKLEISNIRYEETNTTKSKTETKSKKKTETSLDEKIKKRKECSSDMKCGSGKCGSGKCGGSSMKCGSGKCGSN